MHRTQTTTLAFALSAALATVIASALAYQGLRGAFEREFEARLAKVAAIAASQVSGDDIAEVRRLGAESGGWFALQAQLDILCSVTGFENLALVDTVGHTVYDVRLAELGLGARSSYDSLAHAAVARALAGRPTVAPLDAGPLEAHAAFAPVVADGRVLGVLAAEARPAWTPELQRLRRRLTTVAALSVAAIALLAGILMRATARQLSLERQLSRSENLAAMGRMTATLAHEIKNPLAIIRGSAKRLGRLAPDAQAMTDSVVEEVDRLGRTVSRYLQFARGEADATPGRGDLVAAVGATLDLLEGEARVRRCELAREGLEGAVVVALDPESLKQVALNLVLNALEALPEGGRVRVTLAVQGRHAELAVHDDGPGVPADVLARLGEPFTTTKAQGTGLGLFLTRRLAQGAGGTLVVACPPGRGTTATVRLPLAG